ncbi:MAG: hypothetical protein JXA71_17035 [Chitinispirillaceae bacterium]|nr:hypothetical protein [Chitinispirillaceae bacterium]
MGFLFSGLFWGVILILLGVSVIVNIVFHIHVPFFRIVIALILVYAGIRVLAGGHWWQGRGGSSSCCASAVKADAFIAKNEGDEYSIVFGRSTFDAETIFAADSGRTACRINTVFGYSVVRIPKSLPVVVRVNSAFSGVRLPDGSVSAFGQTVYRNDAARAAAQENIKSIDLSVVFGGCHIEER